MELLIGFIQRCMHLRKHKFKIYCGAFSRRHRNKLSFLGSLRRTGIRFYELRKKAVVIIFSGAISKKFWKVINVCGFRELGFSGPQYTRVDKWSGSNLILERLDRAFGATDWFHLFRVVRVTHLPRTLSDHHPILLECMHGCVIPRGKRPLVLLFAWFSMQALLLCYVNIGSSVMEILFIKWRNLKAWCLIGI